MTQAHFHPTLLVTGSQETRFKGGIRLDRCMQECQVYLAEECVGQETLLQISLEDTTGGTVLSLRNYSRDKLKDRK